jgi:mannose-6-phosphate isomerase-like protein (cupin superfamily)
MRVVLALTALACLTQASGVHAQDTFGSVTVEPRPEEYILWDAAAFAAKRAELEKRIEDGDGIWGTGFAFDRVLQAADHRQHNISIVHRQGYTQPEIHEEKWDIYVVVEGSGTLLVGGQRINWINDGRTPDEQRPRLGGAQAFQVTEGDVMHVPARVWHQLVLDEGRSMTYMLINVMENQML